MQQAATYRDPDAPLEQRVQSLLEALTLEEKLSLCAGQGAWETKPVPRLGIRGFRMTDGPRGVGFHSSFKRCTAFPTGISQAAAWDPELMERYGAALAREAASTGARVILAPAINITRTPLNGRTFEYLSEDPLLNGRLATAQVNGIQGEKVAACLKHFAANSQETERMSNNSVLSERALQEIYLPAFRVAVEQADAWCVMAAYNAVNGVAACESDDLLNQRLRKQWGFRGFVVSDWFAVRRISSPEAGVKGGLSLEMPGRGSRFKHKNLRAAWEQKLFTEQELDANLSGLLRVMILTGHIDGDYPVGERNTAEHQGLAREMAEAGMTLLKNEGAALPLDPANGRKLCVLGPKLKRRNCWPLWGGSAGVWPPYEVTPLQGLESENRDRFEFVPNPEDADTVVLFLGTGHRPGQDSETRDRHSMDLPQKQRELLTDTVAKNPNTVVVLVNGGPLTMPWLDQVQAVLQAWYPGMEGGKAIARTLFGDCNPGGKLPLTFPRALADSPAHKSPNTYPGVNKTVHYEEELLVGYRHFDRHGVEPLFPFGHGLSYTSFEYADLQLQLSGEDGEPSVDISLQVTNSGPVSGAEVVQLYVASQQAPADRPEQELKDFHKLQLAPGESSTVRFTLPLDALQHFCPEEQRWVAAAGLFEFRVCSSSRDVRLVSDITITP